MLMFSMSVSIDGYVNDRDGDFSWGAPSDELFDFHLREVAGLGAYLLGRRLYETMRVWETDPAMRDTGPHIEFADVWDALPKVVFSRTLTAVPGAARLAETSLADEIVAAVGATGEPVSIGGADLAGQAIALDLVDELRVYRCPVVVGGGTPYLPALDRPLAFDRVETRTFAESDVVFERYLRARRPR